ncbi:Josephin-domain-containing protein [Amylostereum chailletii]|nr:Josephin-domain-containing protein [Amylostereum chailletii]
MATLENVVPLIYHEKQQPGSMLCAQHAINSLLQGNYFTAPDLSSIAQSLDTLEESYDDDQAGRASANMDDTGFFSVQVLENALDVWGLGLVRWRSEAMLPYHERPHTQLGFILNLQQHWFTLRRFGDVSPHPDQEPGNGHWFNLNSFLHRPEWVSDTYLGMVLQQSETEGYSVFAVIQKNPLAPLALPRTQADNMAATCPPPSSSSIPQNSTTRSHEVVDGFEDEDYELQAAIQASMGGNFDPSQWPRFASSGEDVEIPRVQDTIAAPSLPGSFPSSSTTVPDDPVAASMARNRVFLERMQREQEFALREQYEGEVSTRFGAPGHPGRGVVPQQDEEDEDEMLRRAIAESEALAQAEGHGRVNDEEDEDEDVEIPDAPLPRAGAAASNRVYDDDDAELQAALKASLESMPPDFKVPDTPPRSVLPALLAPALAPVPPTTAPLSPAAHSADDYMSETETEAETEPHPPPQEDVSVEEMRRRRLARFGGA